MDLKLFHTKFRQVYIASLEPYISFILLPHIIKGQLMWSDVSIHDDESQFIDSESFVESGLFVVEELLMLLEYKMAGEQMTISIDCV